MARTGDIDTTHVDSLFFLHEFPARLLSDALDHGDDVRRETRLVEWIDRFEKEMVAHEQTRE